MQKKEMIQMETEIKQKISSEICRYHKMSLDITRYPKITMQRVIHEIGAFQSDLYFLNCKFQQRCEKFSPNSVPLFCPCIHVNVGNLKGKLHE